MNCDCFFHRSINIIIDCSFLENLLHRKSSSRNFKDGSIAKKAGEFLCIHRCRRNDKFDVSSFLGNFFENTEKDISVETSFMSLVHNDSAVHLKFRIIETFSQKDTISHVLDDCFF